MEYPKNLSEFLVLIAVGKTGPISGTQIERYIRDKKLISSLDIPSTATKYNALKRLSKKGLIRINNSIIRKNFKEDFWVLTDQGRSIYDDVSNTFHIRNCKKLGGIDLTEPIPNWTRMIAYCEGCEENNEYCFRRYKYDLESVILNNYEGILPPGMGVKMLFKTPKELQEFLFWLIMLNESRRKLKKYSSQLEKIGIKEDLK